MLDDSEQKVVTNHKEDMPSRNTADSMDRNNIRDKFITFIDLLDLSCHPANTTNNKN